MLFNIDPGELNHYVKILEDSGEKNRYNEPEPPVELFDARANVLVRSGSESSSFGVTVTDEVITVKMWFDTRAKNDMYLEWEDVTYRIKHIRPDSIKKGMMLTCMVERDS